MKKHFYAFLIKKTPLYAGLGLKQKLLAIVKQLITKNFVCCLKNWAIFFTERMVQLGSTPSPCSFSFAF